MSNRYLDDPDVRLMLRVKDGDGAAFGGIVERYGPLLVNFVGRYTGDRVLAEDLAQEALLRAFKAAGSYRPAARFKTWLLTIATNVCINRKRWEKRHLHLSIDVPVEAGSARSFADDLEAMDAGPDAPAEKAELIRTVRRAILGLPERQRAAVILARYHELPYAEIAEVLGLTVMAVKSLLNRAKENLRESLRREIGAHGVGPEMTETSGGRKAAGERR